MNNKGYDLGLDISTSIIGLSLFKNDVFVKFFHVDLTKTKCIFDKAKEFEKVYMKNIEKNISIHAIYIEDTLQSFARGMSSARTLMQLSKFNGIISNKMYSITGIKPVFINVNKARKQLNIQINKNIEKDKKEQIVEWVNNDMGGYAWPTKVISRGKNKGLVKYEKFCYDIADAYVICKAGIIIDKQCSKKN